MHMHTLLPSQKGARYACFTLVSGINGRLSLSQSEVSFGTEMFVWLNTENVTLLPD